MYNHTILAFNGTKEVTHIFTSKIENSYAALLMYLYDNSMRAEMILDSSCYLFGSF